MNLYIKIFLFVIILSHSVIFSQDYIIKHYSTSDGLVNNDITQIFEDKKGNIWFATTGGISKWNGVNFENYDHKNGLPYIQVFDIYEDDKGKLYFATFGNSIVTYKDGIMDTLDKNDGYDTKYTWCIIPRADGSAYFCGGAGTISILKDGKFSLTSLRRKLKNRTVNDIWESNSGITLFGCYDLGIGRMENDSIEFSDYGFGKTILFIKPYTNNTLFVGTDSDLYVLDPFKNKATKPGWIKHFNCEVFDILKMQDGRLFITSGFGTFIKDEDNLIKIDDLKINFSSGPILETKNGYIIVGNNNGFYVFNPGKLEKVKINGNFINEEVFDVIKDNNKRLILTGSNGIVYEGKKTFYSDFNIPAYHYSQIFENNKNEILFSSFDSGVYAFKNNQFTSYFDDKKISKANNVTFITQFEENSNVLCTWRGVVIKDNKSVKFITKKEGLAADYTSAVLYCKDSTIYYGSHGSGLSILKNAKFEYINTGNGLSDNAVNCLLQRSDGAILVGTQQGGINILQHGFIDTILVENGLLSNSITSLVEDNSGKIYAGSAKGLNIINFYDREYLIRYITKEDGLLDNYCNIGALYIDESDNVYIGTQGGLNKYNPKYDLPQKIPPPIFITGFEIYNIEQDLLKFKSNPILDYDENYLKFIFAGIDVTAPHKILYKYKLSNVDKDWVESKTNNVQYTSLDDGFYTFEVKARNEWGYWSEPVSLAFTINPVWWKTWWFRLSSIILIGILLWLAFQYRLNYLLKLERLRIKIATDLHDEVGSLLTQISVNADSLSYINDTSEIKEKGGVIRNKATEVINMMSDVIWSIDSRNDNLESLVDRIHNFAQNFLDLKDIVLNFSTDIINLQKPLKTDFRQNVMLIAKEAVNNAVKYSGGSKIEIIIKYRDDKFEMIIFDNGKGFDFENIKKGNGLKNMKMRAKSIGADIEFRNENGFKILFIKNKW